MEKSEIKKLILKQVTDFCCGLGATHPDRVFFESDRGYQVLHSAFTFGKNDERNVPFGVTLPKQISIHNLIEIYRIEKLANDDWLDLISETYDLGSKVEAVEQSIKHQNTGRPLPGVLHIPRKHNHA